MLFSIEVEHCCIFKEIIRLMECQRSDTEKDQLIKDGKRIRIYEMNKQSWLMINQWLNQSKHW